MAAAYIEPSDYSAGPVNQLISLLAGLGYPVADIGLRHVQGGVRVVLVLA